MTANVSSIRGVWLCFFPWIYWVSTIVRALEIPFHVHKSIQLQNTHTHLFIYLLIFHRPGIAHPPTTHLSSAIHPSSIAIHPCTIQTFPFYYPSIQLSDCLSSPIHPPIHSSTYPPIHLLLNYPPFICSYVYPCLLIHHLCIHVSSTHLPLCSSIMSSSSHLSTQLLFHLPPIHHPSICASDMLTLTEQPASIVRYLPNPFQGPLD